MPSLGAVQLSQSVCAGAILLCSSDVLSLKEIKEFLNLAQFASLFVRGLTYSILLLLLLASAL